MNTWFKRNINLQSILTGIVLILVTLLLANIETLKKLTWEFPVVKAQVENHSKQINNIERLINIDSLRITNLEKQHENDKLKELLKRR